MVMQMWKKYIFSLIILKDPIVFFLNLLTFPECPEKCFRCTDVNNDDVTECNECWDGYYIDSDTHLCMGK